MSVMIYLFHSLNKIERELSTPDAMQSNVFNNGQNTYRSFIYLFPNVSL